MHKSLRLSFLAACSAVLFLACPPARATCGNGVKETGEVCDDGNTNSGDSCASNCQEVTEPDGGTGGGSTGGGGGGGGGSTGGGGGSTGGGGGSMAVCGNGVIEGDEDCDDRNMTAGDGCENDCSLTPGCGNGKREGTEVCDDGNTTAGDGCETDCSAFTNTATIQGCPGINQRVRGGQQCAATLGDTSRLVTGIILADGVTYVGGQVLVDGTGAITCAACDCSATAGASTASTITCPRAVVSPGLINAHDHISYQASPQMRTTERYEHRHDWRRGNNGHTSIGSGTNNVVTSIRWAELRQVMSGTTSIVGATFSATGNPGMLRNLDSNVAGQLGMVAGTSGVNSDTFPLGDTGGLELTTGCGYPSLPTAAPGTNAYLPHVSEGIEPSARNEFVCLTQNNNGILSTRTSIVHGIGVNARDIALMASTQTSLVWSPRSNISLYGDTAAIPLYSKLGVNIALGTDWTISGSMNLLRELQCADGLNSNSYNHALSDEALWRTVTAGGADATRTQASIGRLAVGKLGDLAIYARKPGSFYRSIIDAQPQDVLLTMRGGKVLYGEQAVVQTFDSGAMCDAIDVCGAMKAACVSAEFPALAGANAANTVALLKMANTATYPLFFCGTTPTNEPSCVPERSATSPKGSNSKLGSTIYTSASTDTDKDGIDDTSDNCPMVFNPVRPMDAMQQADIDGDQVGDVCDPCPLNANVTTCLPFNPNDRDGDGVDNSTDNCPNLANPGQLDGDGDQKGDDCDACPATPNPGTMACPSDIYSVKKSLVPAGQPFSLHDVLVTAVGPSGYFLQVSPTDSTYQGSDFSGLYAYQPNPGVNAGDRLDIPLATASNFNGQIQLNGALGGLDGGVRVLSTGNALPAPVVGLPIDFATDGGRATALEGVLVRVDSLTVTDVAPPLGVRDVAPSNEFVVNGSLRVNDYFWPITPFPALNQSYVSLTGVLEWRNGDSKLEPRGPTDVVTGPPTLARLSPSVVFMREDAGVTLPSPLLAELTGEAWGDTAVSVVSSGPEVVVGDGGLVIVADGGRTAEVPLFAVASTDGGTVSISATLAGASTNRTAQVRVIGPAEVAKLISLTPATVQANAGGQVTLTATLDFPPEADTTLNVVLMPNTAGMVPATATVTAGHLSVDVVVALDAMAMGTATVTVSLGTAMLQSVLTVQQTPVTSHPVISEFSPRGTVGAFDEFVELYNPTNADVDLDQWKLQTKSATATTWTDRVVFGAGTMIVSKGFVLTANTAATSGYTTPTSGPAADFPWLTPSTGLGDTGVIRLIRPDGSVADAVAFGPMSTSGEGMPLAAHPGTMGAARSFERKALPTSTEATMNGTGADALSGNAQDADNNATDFYLRTSTTRDPQNSRSPTE